MNGTLGKAGMALSEQWAYQIWWFKISAHCDAPEKISFHYCSSWSGIISFLEMIKWYILNSPFYSCEFGCQAF